MNLLIKMEQKFTVRNCNVPCCNGQHFIEFINGVAIIPTWEFFQIIEHWKENVKEICGLVCSKHKIICDIHKKLDFAIFVGKKILVTMLF